MAIKAGLAMKIARHLAREIATFSRFLLYRNPMFLGKYSPLEVAIDTMTASASCP